MRVFIKRKFIFLLGILILITIFFIFSYFYNKPNYILKDRIKLELPDSTEVIYYEHSIFDFSYDRVMAKFEISENEIEYIQNQFENKENFLQYDPKVQLDQRPPFGGYKWFEIKDETVVYYICTPRTDKNFNDKGIHKIWAFICKEDGKYFLYLSF